MSEEKQGFVSPNHTQVPNDLFDVHLPDLGHAELKILLAIIRQTLGFHRKHKRLSLTDLEKATGLARSSVQEGCERLADTGLVSREKHGKTTVWVVNWRDEPPDMGLVTVPETGIVPEYCVPETGTDYTGSRYSDVPETGTPSFKESIKEKLKEKGDSRSQDS